MTAFHAQVFHTVQRAHLSQPLGLNQSQKRRPIPALATRDLLLQWLKFAGDGRSLLLSVTPDLFCKGMHSAGTEDTTGPLPAYRLSISPPKDAEDLELGHCQPLLFYIPLLMRVSEFSLSHSNCYSPTAGNLILIPPLLCVHSILGVSTTRN